VDVKKYLKNKKIGVIYGGTSPEREISLLSGKAVFKALKKLGVSVCLIDAKNDIISKLKKAKIKFAYIALHGTDGEDGKIQSLLEFLNIPYTGSGVLASALSMDKAASKKLFKYCNINTPAWTVIKNGDCLEHLKNSVCYPVVVKPVAQGSAIGISIVSKKESFKKALADAFKRGSSAIVENYVKGTEITIGVLGGAALPVIEIVPKNKFYDFNAKYSKGGSKHIVPSALPKAVQRQAQTIAEKIYKEFDCRAMCRIDMIVDASHKIWVLEINTVPGMTQTSLLPEAALEAGINFENLVLKIMEYSITGK